MQLAPGGESKSRRDEPFRLALDEPVAEKAQFATLSGACSWQAEQAPVSLPAKKRPGSFALLGMAPLEPG
jgi:hypothetical protein